MKMLKIFILVLLLIVVYISSMTLSKENEETKNANIKNHHNAIRIFNEKIKGKHE